MMRKTDAPAIRFKGFTEPWEQRKLSDNVSYDSSNLTVKDGKEEGLYDLFDANGFIGRTDFRGFSTEYISIIKDGAGVGRIRKMPPKTMIIGTMGALQAKNADLSFVFALLSQFELNKTFTGSTIPHIYFKDYGNNIYFFPQINEQKSIGMIFSAIDDLITLHQRKLEKLKSIKKSMLEKMFPQNGSSYPAIRFKGFTEPWEQRKLGELVDVCSGSDYKHLSEGSIPVYGTGGYMLSVDDALSYDKDAIGIGRKGTIDKPYILKAPFWTVDTLFYAIPREKTDLNFTFNIFQNIDWKKKDESTGVPSLSKTAINNIDVLKPRHNEQRTVGQFFSKLDLLITLHQRKLEKLQNIKKSLLEKMFV